MMPVESITAFDTMFLPNSWCTVAKDKNDRIYVLVED